MEAPEDWRRVIADWGTGKTKARGPQRSPTRGIDGCRYGFSGPRIISESSENRRHKLDPQPSMKHAGEQTTRSRNSQISAVLMTEGP